MHLPAAKMDRIARPIPLILAAILLNTQKNKQIDSYFITAYRKQLFFLLVSITDTRPVASSSHIKSPRGKS